MALQLEWDENKAAANQKKHGVTFKEASTVFGDHYSITVWDPDHSDDEERFVLVGLSYRNRLLVIVFVERNGRIRLISARPATKNERRQYEQG